MTPDVNIFHSVNVKLFSLPFQISVVHMVKGKNTSNSVWLEVKCKTLKIMHIFLKSLSKSNKGRILIVEDTAGTSLYRPNCHKFCHNQVKKRMITSLKIHSLLLINEKSCEKSREKLVIQLDKFSQSTGYQQSSIRNSAYTSKAMRLCK